MADETRTRAKAGRRGAPDVPVFPTLQASTATAFAAKAKDLVALREAVVEAANVGGGLWLSYLFVFFYLAIAAGGVTHRDLLFENPVKLPFLNVELPLTGFFFLGPLLFVIVHAYVLLHFVLLAEKVGTFHTELQTQITDEDARARLRRQLPSNIFVQLLAGPREVRAGVMGVMLRLIAQISLVAAPVALLVLFQLQFLPFHNEGVTWWHRIAVAGDLALLWTLWPSVARGDMTWIAWRDFRRIKIIALMVWSLAPILLVFTIATFPGEWLDANLPTLRFVPQFPPRAEPKANDAAKDKSENKSYFQPIATFAKSMRWASLHDLLVAGKVDFVARKPSSLWSNVLVVPGIDVSSLSKFDSDVKIVAARETVSLRGRQLEGAVLIGAKLRKADFTGAQLQHANISDADLRGAKFDCDYGPSGQICARLQYANFSGAQLQDASLKGALLQNANLYKAQLQRALLDHADLQFAMLGDAQLQDADFTWAVLQDAFLLNAQLHGASLKFADLQGAFLENANLQGASLDSAHLEGASLAKAQLQGATLERAQMQGASLAGAQLQGASLDFANLQGASLSGAVMQGVSFKNTNLAGALLNSVQLQGALLTPSRMSGALLNRIFVWRTDVTSPLGDVGTRVLSVESKSKYLGIECVPEGDEEKKVAICDWSANSFAALKRLIEEAVPPGDRREQAMKRIAILDPTVQFGREKEIADAWTALAHLSVSREVNEDTAVTYLRDVGCDSRSGAYVVHRLLKTAFDNRFSRGSPWPAKIAGNFLAENCAPTRGLSEEDKAILKAIRDAGPPAHPAPLAPKR